MTDQIDISAKMVLSAESFWRSNGYGNLADMLLALRDALDAAEAEKARAVEAAKNQGYVDGYAAAVSDVEVMRATDGVLAGQGMIVSALKFGLTKLQDAIRTGAKP